MEPFSRIRWKDTGASSLSKSQMYLRLCQPKKELIPITISALKTQWCKIGNHNKLQKTLPIRKCCQQFKRANWVRERTTMLILLEKIVKVASPPSTWMLLRLNQREGKSTSILTYSKFSTRKKWKRVWPRPWRTELRKQLTWSRKNLLIKWLISSPRCGRKPSISSKTSWKKPTI